LRVCFNFVSILSFTFGFFQAFFSFVLSLFSLFYSRGCFGITTATFPVFGITRKMKKKNVFSTNRQSVFLINEKCFIHIKTNRKLSDFLKLLKNRLHAKLINATSHCRHHEKSQRRHLFHPFLTFHISNPVIPMFIIFADLKRREK
jgi:hypothetical protein